MRSKPITLRCGKCDEQIDILPFLQLWIHYHDIEPDKKLRHAHLCFQWLFWWAELTIGKEHGET